MGDESSLDERLAAVLAEILTVRPEADGSILASYDGTLASLRTVEIAEGLELVSLSQVLAWDLPATAELRVRAADATRTTQLGTVLLAERAGEGAETADVLLRYNFPGTGLTDDALRTLVMLVLTKGVEIREGLLG